MSLLVTTASGRTWVVDARTGHAEIAPIIGGVSVGDGLGPATVDGHLVFNIGHVVSAAPVGDLASSRSVGDGRYFLPAGDGTVWLVTTDPDSDRFSAEQVDLDGHPIRSLQGVGWPEAATSDGVVVQSSHGVQVISARPNACREFGGADLLGAAGSMVAVCVNECSEILLSGRDQSDLLRLPGNLRAIPSTGAVAADGSAVAVSVEAGKAARLAVVSVTETMTRIADVKLDSHGERPVWDAGARWLYNSTADGGLAAVRARDGAVARIHVAKPADWEGPGPVMLAYLGAGTS